MTVRDFTRWVQNEDGSWSRNLGQTGEVGVKATAGAIEAAELLGVDLSTVQGSGKDGRITKADVEAAAESYDGE